MLPKKRLRLIKFSEVEHQPEIEKSKTEDEQLEAIPSQNTPMKIVVGSLKPKKTAKPKSGSRSNSIRPPKKSAK